MRRLLGRRSTRVAAATGLDRDLLRLADRHLRRQGGAVALLVEGTQARAISEALGRLRPGLEPVVVEADGDASDRHVRLTRAAPYDLVVDLGPVRERVRRFRDTVFHLRDGGALVVPGAAEAADAERLLDLAHRVEQARPRRPPGPRATTAARDDHALARATQWLGVETGHLLAVGRDVGARAKLDEPEMATYLAAGSRHRVVETVPGGPFRPRCEVRESEPDHRGTPPEVLHPPDLALREYRDVVAAPRQVVCDERVLVPDTFRHNQRARLVNKATDDLAPRFARVPGADEAVPLEGTWYHLDNEVRGHFGHLLTETLSRMWAWPLVKQQHPEARVLLGRTRKRPDLQPWERVLLSAGGIEPGDVELIDRPVRVPRLLSATPMLSNPHYVHPGIAETWDRVGDALERQATPGERPRRLFCTRHDSEVRPCRNTGEVEAFFAAHGFTVIHPAEHSLPEQVALFRSAEVVAGFAGSGLFQLCFAREPKRVITLGSTRYSARNEYLIAAVRGHTIEAIRSRPEEDHYHSGFTVDFAREGHHLEAVLASL